ncbi:MAG: hypothetical protein M0R50_11180 [Candidatus Cloacimonetes bacterium]|jgi:hypothetical protein|nr:hypothetical protein [Candidatus Cloacimonadota bacterium]
MYVICWSDGNGREFKAQTEDAYSAWEIYWYIKHEAEISVPKFNIWISINRVISRGYRAAAMSISVIHVDPRQGIAEDGNLHPMASGESPKIIIRVGSDEPIIN